MYDPGTADAWKAAVALAARAAIWTPLTGAVEVDIDFALPRPKSHYGAGRNAGRLRLQAPCCHTQRPDVDNLAKAVLDALLGIAWRDDSQVIRLAVAKEWTADHAGAIVRIQQVAP